MNQKETEDLVLKYTLQNAVFYKGKANKEAVLGKVMASEPELRLRANQVKEIIKITAKKVNRMRLEDQKDMLEGMAPELFEKKVVEKGKTLPELPGTEEKVVTRFAPAPTGPLNINQLLRAAMLSYLYAEKYNGKFVLRFEDTDAKNIAIEYYEWIKEDLVRAGIKWDKTVIESKNMKLYYKTTESLLKAGKFYLCLCPAKKLSALKKEKKACAHRKWDLDKNLGTWKRMIRGEYKEGEVVVRLKTSMAEKNPALRDPIMLRVSNQFHPMVEDRYVVWPLYNYAVVIEDHESRVTHVFRGKEHEHNTTIQKKIYESLGWGSPYFINFGMIHLPGEKVHTRDLKTRIQKGEYSGWDDPKLHTVRALVRRGFIPETFKKYAVEIGLTKTDITLNWEALESFNRKFLDSMSNRYMVILDPVKISISGLPLDIHSIRQPYHPSFPKRGTKVLPLNTDSVYISQSDKLRLRGREFRLKGVGNFFLKGDKAKYTDNRIEREMKKIQWVSEPNVTVRLVKSDEELEGIGEPLMSQLKTGDVIQMERIGFGRIDNKVNNEIVIYFAHK